MRTTMAKKLLRFGRIRQLHTIISQETIQPSSPTPPHLKTHNLSLLDQYYPNMHLAIVAFFPNYNNGNTKILKQSLSRSLTKYYPFAGRLLTPYAKYIDCNDKGIEFLEAFNNSHLEDFIRNKGYHENLNEVIPNGLGCTLPIKNPNLLVVQLNHFACGGIALTISISHRVADACTMINFINHWATVTSGDHESLVNPIFISSSPNRNIMMPEISLKASNHHPTMRFVFPNEKISKLKDKVIAMTGAPSNPTRVEVLTSLLFKCAVGAATTKSGSLNPSTLTQLVNMRNKMAEKCAPTVAGNIITTVFAKMANSSEFTINEVITELRKRKMEYDGLRDVQEVGEKFANKLSTLEVDPSRVYGSSSLCRFPFYKLDFGWGKPVEVRLRFPDMEMNSLILMDTPHWDGIEALVTLHEEDMAIFQNDKELLAHVKKD